MTTLEMIWVYSVDIAIVAIIIRLFQLHRRVKELESDRVVQWALRESEKIAKRHG